MVAVKEIGLPSVSARSVYSQSVFVKWWHEVATLGLGLVSAVVSGVTENRNWVTWAESSLGVVVIDVCASILRLDVDSGWRSSSTSLGLSDGMLVMSHTPALTTATADMHRPPAVDLRHRTLSFLLSIGFIAACHSQLVLRQTVSQLVIRPEAGLA